MKSLEARLADRERREQEAEEQKEQAGEILSTGTMAEGQVVGQGEEEEEDEGYESWTVAELKAKLDELEVDYKSNANKGELIELVEANIEAE